MRIKLELSKKQEDQYVFNMSSHLLSRLINDFLYKNNCNRSILRDRRYKQLNNSLTAKIICSSYPIDTVLVAYVYLYNKANHLIGSAVCYSNGFIDTLFNIYNTVIIN